MRRMWLFPVLIISMLLPVTVYAQGPIPPTPTPSVVQVCLDEKLGTCIERVKQDFGYGGIILAVFIVAVLLPPVRKKLQEWIEGIISKNPFTRNIGLRRYLRAFIAENRVFGFRGMVDYALKPIDLTNAYIQLDLSFSKLAEKEARKKDGDSTSEKALMRQVEKVDFRLAQILKAGYKKIAVVGDAGSGKSALLQWAGMTIAQGCLSQKISKEQLHYRTKLVADLW